MSTLEIILWVLAGFAFVIGATFVTALGMALAMGGSLFAGDKDS